VKLTEVHAEVPNHAGEIAELFRPGAKVTILVRNPGLDDGDMVITDDAIDSAIAALQNLKAQEELKLTQRDVICNALKIPSERLGRTGNKS
jgi:hypothetical protein